MTPFDLHRKFTKLEPHRNMASDEVKLRDCLLLANDFILQYSLPVSRVIHLKQIRSPLFVHLHNALVGPIPLGVSLHPKSDEEEIRNLDMVIAKLPRQPRRDLNAAKILRGDEKDIHDLLRMFVDIDTKGDVEVNQGCVRSQQSSTSNLMAAPAFTTKPRDERDASSVRSAFLETDENDENKKDMLKEHGMSFLQFVESKLAGLDAPKITKHQLKKKYERYLKFEAKSVASCVKRKSRSDVKLQEVQRRQTMLSRLVAKEAKHGELLENVRKQRCDNLAEQRRLRERRTHLVHVERSKNEAAAALRKTTLARKNKGGEELKELCEENLRVRKTRLITYLKDEKEQTESESALIRLQSEAAGKFYEDQLSTLAGSLQTEVTSLSAQEKAQSKLIDEFKKEHRKVRMQKVQRCNDKAAQKVQRNIHRRELDVRRLKEDLWKMP